MLVLIGLTVADIAPEELGVPQIFFLKVSICLLFFFYFSSFFFFFFLIEYGKKGYNVGSFPLLILMEEKIGNLIGMLSKT
jgi:hypothetical protein